MARIAQKYRPKMAHAKGAKVTLPSLGLHAVVLDQHVSYRVQRRTSDGMGLIAVQVGEDEDVAGWEGDPVDASVSYLVERQWDGVQVWVEERQLIAGHDMGIRNPSLVSGSR